MNWNLGLKRISAAAWGIIAAIPTIVWAILGATTSDTLKASDLVPVALILLLVWGAAFGLHKLTCWIINGFFKV